MNGLRQFVCVAVVQFCNAQQGAPFLPESHPFAKGRDDVPDTSWVVPQVQGRSNVEKLPPGFVAPWEKSAAPDGPEPRQMQATGSGNPGSAPIQLVLGMVYTRRGSQFDCSWAIESFSQFKLGVDDVNAQQILPPGYVLNFTTYDSQDATGNPLLAMAYVVQMFALPNVVGLVGTADSGSAGPPATYASTVQIPMVSPGSSLASLADKTNFPYFMRTIGSDATILKAMAIFFYTMNWRRAGVVVNSDFYLGMSGVLPQAFSTFSIAHTTFTYSPVSSSSAEQTMALTMTILKSAGYRVFLLYGKTVDAPFLTLYANSTGLFNKGYMWVVTLKNNDYAPMNVIPRMVYCQIDPGPANPLAVAYASRWASIARVYDCNKDAPYDVLTAYPFWGNQTYVPGLYWDTDYTCVGDGAPDGWGVYLYDLAFIYAKAMKAVITGGTAPLVGASRNPAFGPALKAALLATNHSGITGNTILEQDTQDRWAQIQYLLGGFGQTLKVKIGGTTPATISGLNYCLNGGCLQWTALSLPYCLNGVCLRQWTVQPIPSYNGENPLDGRAADATKSSLSVPSGQQNGAPFKVILQAIDSFGKIPCQQDCGIRTSSPQWNSSDCVYCRLNLFAPNNMSLVAFEVASGAALRPAVVNVVADLIGGQVTFSLPRGFMPGGGDLTKDRVANVSIYQFGDVLASATITLQGQVEKPYIVTGSFLLNNSNTTYLQSDAGSSALLTAFAAQLGVNQSCLTLNLQTLRRLSEDSGRRLAGSILVGYTIRVNLDQLSQFPQVSTLTGLDIAVNGSWPDYQPGLLSNQQAFGPMVGQVVMSQPPSVTSSVITTTTVTMTTTTTTMIDDANPFNCNAIYGGTLVNALTKLAINYYLPYVDTLSWSQCGLTGMLSDSLRLLLNMRSLRELSLNNNQLTGPVPPQLQNLRQLTTFAAASNQLNGTLPPELGNMTQLVSINLGANLLGGPIPVELGKLKQLQYLTLNSNSFTSLPGAAIRRMTALLFLDVSSNQLSGSITIAAPSLLRLTVSHNLFVSVAELSPSLQILDLSSNLLTGPFPNISLLTNLTQLDFSNNYISGPVPALATQAQLQKVVLSSNAFSGAVPGNLTALPNLRTLRLGSNPGISGKLPDITSPLVTLEAANCSLEALGAWPSTLETVNLNDNNIQSLPDNWNDLVTQSSSLTILRLRNNWLTGWEGFGVFNTSRILSEGTVYQTVVGGAAPSSPPLQLSQLLLLDLSENPLNVDAKLVVYSTLYVPFLQSLACASCGLTGTIPTLMYTSYPGFATGQATLGATEQSLVQGYEVLQSLDLSGNNITGISWPPPPQLLTVNLASNAFSVSGLHPGWFNTDGSYAITSLDTTGNPFLRTTVKEPQDSDCSRVPKSAGLTAQAIAFAAVNGTPGIYCTILCQPAGFTYRTDVLDPEGMCRCKDGWEGNATTCSPCPADFFSQSNASDIYKMKKVCKACPSGSSTNNLTEQSNVCSCTCKAGTYLNTGMKCMGSGSYNDTGVVDTCLSCPLLKTSPAGSLQMQDCSCDSKAVIGLQQLRDAAQSCSCADGSYLNWQVSACLPCASSGEICYWSTITNMSKHLDPPDLVPGFWAATGGASRANFSGHSIFACFSPQTCLDEKGTCATGRYGKACSSCIPGYAGGPDGPCKRCVNTPSAARVGLLATPFIIWPTTLGMHVLISNEEVTASLQRLQADSFSAKMEPVTNCLLQLLKYVQIISVVVSVQVSLPPQMKRLTSGTQSATVSIYDSGGIGCLAEAQSAGLDLGFKWAFPLAAALIALAAPLPARAIGFLLCKAFTRCPKVLKIGESLRTMSFKEAFQVIVLVAVQYFLTTLVSNGLVPLTCVQSPNGRYTVQAYPHIECPRGLSVDTKEWWDLFAPCMIYNAIFLALLPVAVNFHAWRSVVRTLAETNMELRGTWRSLCGNFRDSHVHWTTVSTLKDLLVNIISQVLDADPCVRLLLTAMITSVYALMILREQPFKHPVNNTIEAWISLSTSCILILLASALDKERAQPVLMALTICGLAVPVSMTSNQLLGSFRRTRCFVWRALQPLSREVRLQRELYLERHLGAGLLFKALQSVDTVTFEHLDSTFSEAAGLVDMVQEPCPSFVPLLHASTAFLRRHRVVIRRAQPKKDLTELMNEVPEVVIGEDFEEPAIVRDLLDTIELVSPRSGNRHSTGSRMSTPRSSTEDDKAELAEEQVAQEAEADPTLASVQQMPQGMRQQLVGLTNQQAEIHRRVSGDNLVGDEGPVPEVVLTMTQDREGTAEHLRMEISEGQHRRQSWAL